jgi:type IV pilus assembly protein PilM
MLGFVQNWFTPKANPIGIDFGSDSLRMAQVRFDGTDHKLFAAACADVPSHAQMNIDARFDYFSETVKELFSQGKFYGRQCVLSLPAHQMYIQHLRLPRMDEANFTKAIRWELKGKLPIDTSGALIRHIVAGELPDSDGKLEVIVMAAAREGIERYLKVAAKCRLDVIGMNIEPMALVDCFSHVHRRKTDADLVNLYVDIGAAGTRATIAQGTNILFARAIPVGGNELNAAVASVMKCNLDDARLLRLKHAASEPAPVDGRDQRNVTAPPAAVESIFPGLGPTAAPAAEPTPGAQPEPDRVEQACITVINRMVEELTLCRRYHESTFSAKPVQRLIFIGGEARQRWVCQRIAREMGLAAQVGDPLVRMGRISEIPIESGLDRRLPQPAWSVAIGLSFGPRKAVEVVVDDSRAVVGASR